jgi:hypothetical protein
VELNNRNLIRYSRNSSWTFAISLVVFLLSLQLQAAVASQATNLSFDINGRQPIFATPALDICGAFHVGSCPLFLTVYENLAQQVTLSASVDASQLEPGQTATVALTPSPSTPTDSLDFVFTAGGSSYTYNYPVSSLPAIGSTSAFNIPIPIGTIMLALGLPSIPGLYFDVNSQIGTDLEAVTQGKGFAQSAVYSWTGSSTQSNTFQFNGGADTATIGIYLQSAHQWQTSLSVSVPILGSVTLYTAPKSTTQFSSTSQTAFTWFHVLAESQYSTVSGSGWYLSGDSATVSIQSSPVSNGEGTQEVFMGWRVQNSGLQESINFIVNSPITETAEWQTQFYLTVGSAYGTPSPVSGWFNAGTAVSASVDSPISGGSGTQYVVTGWTGTGSVSGSGSMGSTTFSINARSSITWNWKTQYSVTVQSSIGGMVSPSTGTQWYDSGYQLQLAEAPSSGYQFLGWVVNGQATSSQQTFTYAVTSPVTITAQFAPLQQTSQLQTSAGTQPSSGTGPGGLTTFAVNLALGAGIGAAVAGAIVALVLRRMKK